MLKWALVRKSDHVLGVRVCVCVDVLWHTVNGARCKAGKAPPLHHH
jgi:hypothetical protein